MRHGLSGLSTNGLKGPRKGDEHPAYAPVGVWHLYLYRNFSNRRRGCCYALYSGAVETSDVTVYS